MENGKMIKDEVNTDKHISKNETEQDSTNKNVGEIETEREYALSQGELIFIVIYYMVCILAGTILAILEISEVFDKMNSERQTIYYFATAVMTSFGGAIAFSSMYYIRKIYKICMRKRIVASAERNEHIGYMLYFLTRPIFAVLFSILAVAMMLGGIFVVAANIQYVLNSQFVVMSFVISCSVGFSVGKIIDLYTGHSFENIKKVTGTSDGR